MLRKIARVILLALGALVGLIALVVALVLAFNWPIGHSRDARALGATTFGRMPAPAGAALVEERYAPPELSQGLLFALRCGRLERVFGTDDALSFARAFYDAARAAHWEFREESADRFVGHAGPLVRDVPGIQLYGEGTMTQLVVADLEGSAIAGVDASRWRYASIVTITDWDDPERGGGCNVTNLFGQQLWPPGPVIISR